VWDVIAQQVRRPRPVGRATFSEAMRAWFAGDFEGCLAICDRVRPTDVDMLSQVALLRARALLRLGRPQEAVTVVSGAFVAHGTLDASLTAQMLLGQGYVRLGEHERGLAILERAERGAAGAHATIRSELALNVALAYFGLRRLDDADAALERVAPESDIVHARSIEYRGWVAVARADFARASREFSQALHRLDACRHADRFLEATAIQGLVTLAAERLDRPGWLLAQARAERLDWSAGGLADPRHLIALAFSMLHEADGRTHEALQWTRVAESAAFTEGRALLALCRRAAILRAAAEPFAHADLVAAIQRRFERLGNGPHPGDEHGLPLALAEEVAYAGDVLGARALVRRHDALPPSSRMLIMDDPRMAAHRTFVEAVIARAAREEHAARERYQRAFRYYRAIGYTRRAALAAFQLGELTGQAYLLDYARTALRVRG
jgi:tetratricopeptide (TPR) repeat protein